MKIFFVLLASLLAACSSSDSSLINSAENAIRDRLKDSASAQFGKAFIVTPSEESTRYITRKMVCGDVNAKNSYGGYTGAVRYIAMFGKESGGDHMTLLNLEIEPEPNSEIFNLVWWQPDCKSQSRK